MSLAVYHLEWSGFCLPSGLSGEDGLSDYLFLEVIGRIVASVMVVVLWSAIYKGACRNMIGGNCLPEMVTYLPSLSSCLFHYLVA